MLKLGSETDSNGNTTKKKKFLETSLKQIAKNEKDKMKN